MGQIFSTYDDDEPREIENPHVVGEIEDPHVVEDHHEVDDHHVVEDYHVVEDQHNLYHYEKRHEAGDYDMAHAFTDKFLPMWHKEFSYKAKEAIDKGNEHTVHLEWQPFFDAWTQQKGNIDDMYKLRDNIATQLINRLSNETPECRFRQVHDPWSTDGGIVIDWS
jgi:hypothetical protein